GGGGDGDEEEGHGGVQGDDAPEHAERGADEPEEAEGAFPVDEARGHADGEATGGDDQAGDDGDVGQLAPAFDQLGVVGADVAEGGRCVPVGEGGFERRPGPFDGTAGSVGADLEGGDGQ